MPVYFTADEMAASKRRLLAAMANEVFNRHDRPFSDGTSTICSMVGRTSRD
jgi:hypothetical protein